MNAASQTVTTFSPPLGEGQGSSAVTAGPDGNLRVDTSGGFTSGQIDVLVPDPLIGQAHPCELSRYRSAADAYGDRERLDTLDRGLEHTSVATVAPGGSGDQFTVTATGAGTCKITISDGLGNSVAVKVTVT